MFRTLALALAAAALAAGPARGAIIADSVAEFSGVQGQDNWFYGYYDGPFTPADFQLMTVFDPPSLPGIWVVDFDPPSPFVWTALSASEAHPNGTSTSGGRDPVEHWAVRRWVSEVDGVVTITGTIADDNPGTFGNGVIGRIFVGAAEVFTVVIGEGDTAGVSYSVTVPVGIGTTVDFALDPRESQDLTDTTVFTAAVEFTPAAVPEPASALLLGAGVVGLAGYARRRRAV